MGNCTDGEADQHTRELVVEDLDNAIKLRNVE